MIVSISKSCNKNFLVKCAKSEKNSVWLSENSANISYMADKYLYHYLSKLYMITPIIQRR